jgi:hypothetical protein
MSKKSSPQIRRLKLPVAESPSSENSFENDNSPLTARKQRTTETRLCWARRVMWNEPLDNRDEYMTMSELLEVAEEQQALVLEAFLVLSLRNTEIENEMAK